MSVAGAPVADVADSTPKELWRRCSPARGVGELPPPPPQRCGASGGDSVASAPGPTVDAAGAGAGGWAGGGLGAARAPSKDLRPDISNPRGGGELLPPPPLRAVNASAASAMLRRRKPGGSERGAPSNDSWAGEPAAEAEEAGDP